jgi:hypothetical protein
VSVSRLTRISVPKPKKAFQSPGTQRAGPENLERKDFDSDGCASEFMKALLSLEKSIGQFGQIARLGTPRVGFRV